MLRDIILHFIAASLLLTPIAVAYVITRIGRTDEYMRLHAGDLDRLRDRLWEHQRRLEALEIEVKRADT